MENPQYPFLKLTFDEKFPRLLITRRPENKNPEQNVYGAFLPIGMARRLFDLLARTFRLHPCELDIQGDFDAPCPEYFLHRCLAPCVEKICNQDTYLETVEIVHLILLNQGELALEKIDKKIERLSDDLDFEHAAEWLNKRLIIEEIIKNAKWQIYASTMNDVITLNIKADLVEIHLTTLRRGKAVGRLFFQTTNNRSEEEVIKEFIERHYRFYAPKQIFVSKDFPERKLLEEKLNLTFERRTKIIAQPPDKLPPSVFKTNNLAPHSFRYQKGQSIADKENLLEELKSLFGLQNLPHRIECFDVAHLMGKEIIAARVVSIDGILQPDDNLVWEFENLSETAALAAAISERLRLLPDKPDLFIIDGAKPQINAVGETLMKFNLTNLPIVGAVKPLKAHNQISHFLTTSDSRIAFDNRSKAMNFLQNLRDRAHQLANETHRELHSLVQIFKNNDNVPRVHYLLVPVRYAERGGNAADLSPIRSLTQDGKIILKTKTRRQKD